MAPTLSPPTIQHPKRDPTHQLVNPDGYFSEPYSSANLSTSILSGQKAIGTLAILSAISLVFSLAGILHQLITDRSKRRHRPFILIACLFIADTFQATSFLIEFHWVRLHAILAPSAACWIQGAFLNMGDVSNASFAMALAIVTLQGLHRKQHAVSTAFEGFNDYSFFAMIAVLWLIPFVLTVTGPGVWGQDFYTMAGNWCWISPRYQHLRLAFHYIWVFLAASTLPILYIYIAVFLSTHRLSSTKENDAHRARINHAIRNVLLYPLIYILCTLMLAVVRMVSMAGHDPSNWWYQVAGALLASQGFFDGVVYGLTRKVWEGSVAVVWAGKILLWMSSIVGRVKGWARNVMVRTKQMKCGICARRRKSGHTSPPPPPSRSTTPPLSSIDTDAATLPGSINSKPAPWWKKFAGTRKVEEDSGYEHGIHRLIEYETFSSPATEADKKAMREGELGYSGWEINSEAGTQLSGGSVVRATP